MSQQRPAQNAASDMTLSEAAEVIAYCYFCKGCKHKERLRLTLVAASYPVDTLVGDLLTLLPCAACSQTPKIVMTLWLSMTSTDRMLHDAGFPTWMPEDEC